jgi:hypothetical protein
MFESTSFKGIKNAFKKREEQIMLYFYFFLFCLVYLVLRYTLVINDGYISGIKSDFIKLIIYNPIGWVMSLRLFPLFWFNFISCILLSIFYYNKLGLSGFFKLNALGLILF